MKTAIDPKGLNQDSLAKMIVNSNSMDCNIHALVTAYHKIYMLGKNGGDQEKGLLDFLLEVAR